MAGKEFAPYVRNEERFKNHELMLDNFSIYCTPNLDYDKTVEKSVDIEGVVLGFQVEPTGNLFTLQVGDDYYNEEVYVLTEKWVRNESKVRVAGPLVEYQTTQRDEHGVKHPVTLKVVVPDEWEVLMDSRFGLCHLGVLFPKEADLTWRVKSLKEVIAYQCQDLDWWHKDIVLSLPPDDQCTDRELLIKEYGRGVLKDKQKELREAMKSQRKCIEAYGEFLERREFFRTQLKQMMGEEYSITDTIYKGNCLKRIEQRWEGMRKVKIYL
ncbi:hypothetical protein B0181_07935 [Moraxella caviae]|uniref:Uncharacterized protein n=1 Tax=Moraxella caviae TaxID=34060 RepID=A0A1S9ZZ01_9GAMM|nr:hypothetical protein [Moraxella caviae]OOR88637.1 hypothetical protein B0181_07935 [Moraxella caviae]STZ13679.1 Uncharacterised protein [Moraxella caviae]